MVNQLSWPIHFGQGFMGSVNLPWLASDHGSLILIISKERTLRLSWILLHGTNIWWINGLSLRYKEDKQMDCISNQVVFFFCSGNISTNKVKIALFQKSTFRVPVHQSSSSIFNVHPSHLMMNFGPHFGLKICGKGGERAPPLGGWGGGGPPEPLP